MNKGGFSWKRYIGISAKKSKISRLIGIPLTKSGRQQKFSRMLIGNGCSIVILIITILPISIIIFVKIIS